MCEGEKNVIPHDSVYSIFQKKIIHYELETYEKRAKQHEQRKITDGY